MRAPRPSRCWRRVRGLRAVKNRLERRYGQGHLHFITCSCYRRLPLLGKPRNRYLFLRILNEVAGGQHARLTLGANQKHARFANDTKDAAPAKPTRDTKLESVPRAKRWPPAHPPNKTCATCEPPAEGHLYKNITREPNAHCEERT